MVENKHSINTVLSFGAKSVNPEILESLLTGRSKTADFLENKVKGIVDNGDNQFILIVGQRGMGKTHLLKVLYSRILKYSSENKLTISYFAEEEYGVANFFDFLLRILNSFIKWYEKDEALLKRELEHLQETSQANQLGYLQKVIEEYVKNRPLLIIAENFGDILEQMGQEEQGRLRAWLYENNNVSIIASNQSISDNFDREDRPFFGFFTPYYLKNLSFEESYSFLISLAEIEKNNKLVEHLKTEGKPQVRAIFDLVKGNHRLLVTFYHFLKTDMLAKVSENFIKTINDLKPYYETYIRYLPAQQQKILRYIALARKPQLGTEISKNCFIEQKSLSKQLSELSKKKLVDAIADPSDKRNKFYDISEPLLRISIEVGEHKEGITALFIDFLAVYYNTDELVNRKSKFLNLLDYCNTDKEKIEIDYEIKAIDKAISVQKDLVRETCKSLIKEEKYDEVVKILITEKFDLNVIYIIISNYAYTIDNYQKAYEYFEKINFNMLEKYTAYIKSESKFLNLYIETMIILGIKNNDIKLIEKAIDFVNKNNLNNIRSKLLNAIARLSIIIHNVENEIHVENLDEQLISLYLFTEKLISSNDEKELQRTILNFYPFIFEILNSNDTTDVIKIQKNFITKISKLSFEERIAFFNNVQDNGFLGVFELLAPIIESDLKANKQEFESIVVNWINNILIQSANLKDVDIFFIQNFISKFENKILELKIVKNYYKIYQEVMLEKNESALYSLPKEQREFFEKNILKRQ